MLYFMICIILSYAMTYNTTKLDLRAYFLVAYDAVLGHVSVEVLSFQVKRRVLICTCGFSLHTACHISLLKLFLARSSNAPYFVSV